MHLETKLRRAGESVTPRSDRLPGLLAMDGAEHCAGLTRWAACTRCEVPGTLGKTGELAAGALGVSVRANPAPPTPFGGVDTPAVEAWFC